MTVIQATDLEYRNNNREGQNSEKYFYDFITALLSVSKDYLIWPYNEKNQMIERVFAYELYHQWRLLIDNYKYKNIILNGEIKKDGSILRNEDFKKIYPDLVLHEQQDSLNNQLIICEIKTCKALKHSRGKAKLKKDIIKLGNAIEYLKFKEALFIQVLDLDNTFKEKVKSYLQRNFKDFKYANKIRYIIKDYDEIRYDYLNNLLKD
ncbi:MAG: hypothetical protein N3F09_06440 [Bacteroidia bacterium]|nr:hypothetical protein [Bacteroidia bacterium]